MTSSTQLQQRAVFLTSKKGEFVIRNRPVPSPADDQILVKIKSTAINPVDWEIQAWGILVQEYPAILGSDAAGEVVAVGRSVSDYKKGDSVFFQGRFTIHDQGTFQEYAVVPADLVSKIPHNITYDAASTIPVATMAGVVALFEHTEYSFPAKGPTASNVPIVILGGSSSVGLYTIQLARIAGFSPIISTASPHNHELVKSVGATHVFDRNVSASQIRAVAPSVSLAFDCISEEETQLLGVRIFDENIRNAKLLTSRSPLRSAIELGASPDRRFPVKVEGIYGIGHLYRNVAVPFWQLVGEWLESGKFVPNRVEVVGGLDDVVKGLEKNKAGVSAVKLVINP